MHLLIFAISLLSNMLGLLQLDLLDLHLLLILHGPVLNNLHASARKNGVETKDEKQEVMCMHDQSIFREEIV